jgi:SAM-dependent methyltransferase
VGVQRRVARLRRRIGELKIRYYRGREDRRLLRALPRRATCAEIGVWKGDHAAAILRWTRPRTLHLIDPWKHRPELRGALYGDRAKGGQAEMDAVFAMVLERFRREIERGRVHVIRASSQEAPLEPATLDWVYIDGDHHYEAVKADLERYARVVRAGGYLAGDDYEPGAWFKDSVRRAVDEFVQTPGCRSLRVIGRKFLIELS